MSYDDDFPIYALEHHGVKGMKWGVRKAKTSNTKSNLQKVGKSLGKRNARKAAKRDAYHDKKMKSSKVYKALYESTPKTSSVKGRDRIRQKSAKAQYRSLQLNVATMVVGGALAAAGSTKNGQRAIKASSDFVITGQSQKIGKNVLNTVTGNPLRYVNAANMKNVVVDSGALGGG